MVCSLRKTVSIKEEKNLSNFAFLIAMNIIDLKIAFYNTGLFHDKTGILRDDFGSIICFRGSNNETESAVLNNYESFQIICSWLDCDGFYSSGIKKASMNLNSYGIMSLITLL